MSPKAQKSAVKHYAVSAVVSAYNSERFMRGCLEDLIGQTLFQKGLLEIVVVDSASPQHEAAIVREFIDRFGDSIIYIRTDARETVYQAWNRGIQASSGRYVSNANTDDRHRPDALEVMAGILDSNPAVDLVYADVLITRTPNETFAQNSATGRHNWFAWDRNTLLGVGCFIGPQPMWRRTLHDFYGWFEPGFVTSGDYEFWLRISQTSDFHYIEEPLGLYLEHDASLEHSNEELKLLENREILAQYRQAADEGKIVRSLVFEQIRRSASTDGNRLSVLMPLLMKVDAMISSCRNVPEAILTAYRNSENGMFALSPTPEAFEKYIRSAEAVLLSGRDWYRRYRETGTSGAVAALMRDQMLDKALQDARREARQGRPDKAVEVILNQAIRIHSESPAPYVELAEILVAAKRYDDAFQVLPEAPHATDRVWMCEIAAICHAALGEEQQAEEAARVVLQQKGERARPLEVLGTLSARRGQVVEAQEYFQRAVKADPGRGEALLALGMLAWGNGDLDGAYRLLRRSLELSPLNADAAGLLHDAALRLSRQADFIGLLQDLLSRMPDTRHLITTLSEALAEAGQLKAAMAQLEQAMVLIGGDDVLLEAALRLRQQLGPHQESLFGGTPTVSLCMIVRDEAANLPRCLSSAKPVVDEIVVVDTGSGDRTVDIARAFGAKLFEFPWNGDFSAARNVSLSQATGQWILVLDADEALAERDYPVFVQTLQRFAGKAVAWSVITRNYTNRSESEGWQANDGTYGNREEGDGWYPSRKVRLFPASNRTRFHGDIHEMVEADLRSMGVAIQPAGFVVHHYGELAEVDRRAKQMRYYQMGRKKLAERPDDLAAMLELAIQAGELGLFQEALELWDGLLASGVATRDVYFNRCYVLMGLKRFSEASEMAVNALEIDPDHKESAYNYGMCLLNLARPEQAIQSVAAQTVRSPDYPLPMALLCVLYLCTGAQDSAAAIFDKLKSQNYAIAEYILERHKYLAQLGHCALADRLGQAAAALGIQTT